MVAQREQRSKGGKKRKAAKPDITEKGLRFTSKKPTSNQKREWEQSK